MITLPNLLTLLRIFIAPLLVVVLLTKFSEDWVGVPQHIAGVSLFLFAAIDAVVDSPIAGFGLQNQLRCDEIIEDLFDCGGFVFELSIQEPPFNDAFQRVTRGSVLEQIGKQNT